MTNNEKIKLLANTLDVDEDGLNAETVLTSLDEWDSMGKISLMAMFEKQYGKQVSVERMSDFEFVRDILDLME